MIDRGKVRKTYDEVRRILMEAWDPIGVRGIPEAQDEYDTYAGQICHLLLKDAPPEEISDYLYRVETELMGIPPDKNNLLRVAKALKQAVI